MPAFAIQDSGTQEETKEPTLEAAKFEKDNLQGNLKKNEGSP